MDLTTYRLPQVRIKRKKGLKLERGQVRLLLWYLQLLVNAVLLQ